MTPNESFRVDPHVKVLDERVVRRAKRYGLDALVYAPHFTQLADVRAKAREHSDDELLVIPGRELFTGSWRNRRHVLAFGLDEPIPDFLTLAGTMAELRRQNAVVLVPHPEFLNVSLDRETIDRYRELVDAVEIYNPKHWAHHNRRARSIAASLSLPTFGSSYAHRERTVGEVWTAFERAIGGVDDLLTAFREGIARRVEHRSGAIHRLRSAAEFAHLGYENSVTKFDRLVLSGTEPTHPEQDYYEGRFDDVRVY
ncbi:PHP-associated domain-containing protein [Halococcus qingdaonensis]|uniref:PHP-associated domain-containing protein n=1 Tax=Halococcus qingdaonensis TaxID=224402 RepID=UPI002115FEFC|nr:PHP-associated domain-containing protein [Halococcus qingdaonensis]